MTTCATASDEDVQVIKGNTKTKADKKAWTSVEDVALARAWIHISTCKKIGMEQGREKFWERILEHFKDTMGETPRTRHGLNTKWKTMNAAMGVFNGLYIQQVTNANVATPKFYNRLCSVPNRCSVVYYRRGGFKVSVTKLRFPWRWLFFNPLCNLINPKKVMIFLFDELDYVGASMDVDDSFDYSNAFHQGAFTGVDITAMSGRLSNGITINEPNPVLEMETRCLQHTLMSRDVTGKGKRKMDDILTSTGSHAVGGHRVAEVLSLCSNHVADAALAFVTDDSPQVSHTYPSNTYECQGFVDVVKMSNQTAIWGRQHILRANENAVSGI
ncbi:myb-like domain, Myb/SANT-like DNA-binding domain protein [Artemisia annua]|uniref:Myb-like domain, Myb/SANT-like DNA-binding domain protein n=1 Tax=Artemisia annua TaxID=35608 RepID=A0A2U1QH47_ARTAN|nr:myb-like domain, Myb/SANT-like DNA-binding domain protein [Artemisia annua]